MSAETTFCTYCGRQIVTAADGALVDADKGASGCSDSFELGGDGEHEPAERSYDERANDALACADYYPRPGRGQQGSY